MHRRRHADAALEHATDHAFDAVKRRDIRDVNGARDAAGLHELDIDDVGSSHSDQLDHLRRTEHALVRHDRRVHPLGDVSQTIQVLSFDRLLDQLQFDAGILQRLQCIDGLLRGPALIGIEPQLVPDPPPAA